MRLKPQRREEELSKVKKPKGLCLRRRNKSRQTKKINWRLFERETETVENSCFEG